MSYGLAGNVASVGPAGSRYYVAAFATLFLLLVCIAVLTTIWVKVAFAVLAIGLRGAHRAGLYSLEERATRTTGKRGSDRWSLALARTLERVSRRLPGDSSGRVYAWILPVILVGVPATLVLAAVTVIAPVSLFVFVVAAGPEPWSLLLGAVALCAYYGSLVIVWYVGTYDGRTPENGRLA